MAVVTAPERRLQAWRVLGAVAAAIGLVTAVRAALVLLVLPLSVPAIASFAIFQFLWVWNDLLVALVHLGTDSEVAIMTARLNGLVGSRGEAWHVLTARAFLTMIVPFVVFLGLQRFFVRGLLAGSVKG